MADGYRFIWGRGDVGDSRFKRAHCPNLLRALQPLQAFSCLLLFLPNFIAVPNSARNDRRPSFLNGLNLLIQRNKRRYGGYIVHIGIVILYIGIMGSKGYFLLESDSLKLGESMQVGAFQLTMKNEFQEERENYVRAGVAFDVKKNGRQLTTMTPARHFYHKAGQGEQDTIESAIRHFGVNDLYIALGDLPPNINAGGVVNVQVYHNPLIGVVWIGVAVMVLGGIVAFAEKYQRKSRTLIE